MREKFMVLIDRFKKYGIDLAKDIKSIRKGTILNFIKSRIKLLALLALFIFLVLGYTVGRINTSRNTVLSKLEIALKDGQTGKLKSLVRVDGKKVTKPELEPLINYYKNNGSMVDSTVQKLKEGKETNDFTLKEKSGLFGDKYYFEIKTYNLKVDSNFEKGEFTLNNKEYINSGDSFTGVIPGVYEVNGKLSGEYGEFKNSKEIVLMKDEKITINFDAILVTIKAPYDDAKIFVNDTDAGINVGDGKEIGPLPIDGSVKMHLEKEFPWGSIKGHEVEVKDVPIISLDINMENDDMKSNIMGNVKDFYSSVFQALNNEDKEKIVSATKETKDKIYDILEKKYFILKNKYEIDDINIIEDKSQYTYSNNTYRATIVVEIDYEVSKNFLGLNKKKDTKKFFTKLVYKDDQWIIEDVENFNL